ncbi:efflux RND transporter periplasmic adaptor subunit [Flavitalea flava]
MKQFKTRIILHVIFIAFLGVLLSACGNPSEKVDPEKDNKNKEREKANPAEKGNSPGKSSQDPVAELSDEQIKAVGITIGTLEKKNLHAVVKASGLLAVPPQNKAEVNVLLGGIIRKISILEGQTVHKGQALAWMENQELVKIQQEYLTLKNGFVFTQEELKRQQELNEAEAGTGKVLQQVQAHYLAEKAKLFGLEKQMQQLGIDPSSAAKEHFVTQVPVLAPISGTIGHISVNTGTFAEPGKPLMEIIDNSQIHCDLIVFEKDLFKVRIGQKVNFLLTNQDNQEIRGEIYGINKSFEDESKGIIVHAIIKNAVRYKLIQGMYVTALIDVGNQLTTAVPVDAVIRSEGKQYIFIVDSTMAGVTRFKKEEIYTGVSELGYVEIIPLVTLATDTKIINKGAFYLQSKLKAAGDQD